MIRCLPDQVKDRPEGDIYFRRGWEFTENQFNFFAMKRTGTWAAMVMTVLLVVGCGEKEQAEPGPLGDHRKSGEEWFWWQRLSAPPASPSIQPSPAALVDDIKGIMDSVRDLAPLETAAAVDRLVSYEDPAIPAIETFLEDESRSVRWTAVQALGKLGSPRPLLAQLRDEWDALAIHALDQAALDLAPWTLPRLLKTLGPYPVDFNPHLMVRVRVADLLIKAGNYSGVPFLIKVLGDNTPAEDPDREWEKDPTLAWEKEEALKILVRLTGDDFTFHVDGPLPVQAEATHRFQRWWEGNRNALWSKAPPLDDPELRTWIEEIIHGLAAFQARNADGARYVLKMMGPPVFPYLAEAALNGDFYERFHSLDIIADLAPLAGGQAAAWSEAIVPGLRDSAPAVRMKAAQALGHLGCEASLSALKAASRDDDADVRLKAAEAMGFIGGEQAMAYLEVLLKEAGEVQLQVEAKAALLRASPAHADRFVDELLHPDAVHQEYALQKLIDQYGDDFGFQVGAPLEERRAAADRFLSLLNPIR